jgi:hypothetical protein
MNLKAKIQAAASKAASMSNDDKKGKYTKTIGPNPALNKSKSDFEKERAAMNAKYSPGSKGQYMASTIKKKEAPMSSMPTLRPTSVSVSVEKRTPAPLAGQTPMGKTKRRG